MLPIVTQTAPCERCLKIEKHPQSFHFPDQGTTVSNSPPVANPWTTPPHPGLNAMLASP
jgi:hypothetical protein